MSRYINGRSYYCEEEIAEGFTNWRDARIAELEAELVQAKLQVARYKEAYQELGDVISHAKCNLLGLKEKPIPDVRGGGA